MDYREISHHAWDWSVATLEAAVRAVRRPSTDRCAGNGDRTVEGVDAVSLSSFHSPSAACVCRTIRACTDAKLGESGW